MGDSLPPAEPRATSALASFDPVVGGLGLAALLMTISTSAGWIAVFTSVGDLLRNSPYARDGSLALNLAILAYAWHRFRNLKREVAAQRESAQAVSDLARLDPLTGLLNRRALMEDASERLNEWRARGLSAAAIVVDVDAFKAINDHHGHHMGDLMLIGLAERIAKICPADALMCRTGGDEFALLFSTPTGFSGLDALGQELAKRLAEPIDIGGCTIASSASVGSAWIERAAPEKFETLLRQADAAMYWAKRGEGERYVRNDPATGAIIARREVLQEALRKAIGSDELFPVYEPVMNLASGEVTGYEMLARWNSAELGRVAPDEFIPIAERSGSIFPLAEHLYRRAFVEASAWPATLSLSVNVSPVQLRDPWFAQKLLQLLTEARMPPRRLTVEITEQAMVSNLQRVSGILQSLRNQGIRIALDDFGTGHASLATLRALPFDTIKIDRSFVAGGTEGTQVAEAVLQLGRSLGLPVVAEGIETPGVARQYQELECAFGQGHLFGREMSGDDVRAAHMTRTTVGKRANS